MLKTLLLSALLLCCINAYAEPVNLSDVKHQLIVYHDSGQYNRDIASVIKEAMYYLQFRLIQNERSENPKKLAFVLSIDEAALSNYKDILYLNFGGTKQQVDALEMRAADPPITAVQTLFNYAKKHDIAIFFITSRPASMQTVTLCNLGKQGYSGWQEVYFEPTDYNQLSVVPYKVAARKQIISEGYDILLNLGSQYSDLKGGNADMDFKLPNPFYLVS